MKIDEEKTKEEEACAGFCLEWKKSTREKALCIMNDPLPGSFAYAPPNLRRFLNFSTFLSEVGKKSPKFPGEFETL